jgi:flagellar basal-body rod protein FlgC
MDVIARNIANSQTTRMPGTNEPYRRQVVAFAPILERLNNGNIVANGVRVSQISGDRAAPFEMIKEPGHAHADKDGYVTMPNVNATKEMADLMVAIRSYEANLKVQESFITMAERAIRLAQ